MVIKLFIIVVLLLFAFVLSAAEVAFYSLTSSKEQSEGKFLEKIFKSSQLLLSTILVSNAIAVFLFTLLGASIAVDISTKFSVSRAVALGIEVVIISGVLIVFADAVPKIVAARNPKLVARLSMPLLALLLILESPIVYPMNSLLSRINARRKKSLLTIDSNGLKKLSKIAARAGVIEENEAQLLGKISFLGEKTVRDAMTMRAEIVSIPDNIKFDEVVESLKKNEHSRLPVFAGTPDNVVGMLYARDFLPDFRRKTHRKKFNVQTLMRKPLFVPETQSLERLIETFKANMVHIAVVVDEFGGLAGIITLSDIVRGIFGSSAESPRKGFLVTRLSDNSFLVKGSARLDEIAGDVEGFEIGPESGDTISSFLVRTHGSVPRVGSRVEVGNFEFEIDQATPKAILQVKLHLLRTKPAKFNSRPV
ncbi:MAG: hemolysin family protein [Candidatus Kryptoniota bacterium]